MSSNDKTIRVLLTLNMNKSGTDHLSIKLSFAVVYIPAESLFLVESWKDVVYHIIHFLPYFH